jgi:CDK-activating kinase assembly factor MAT1
MVKKITRQCPKCKTTDTSNRSLTMMINECGHPICKNCVENIFARNSGPCPVCGKSLKKNDFWEQKYDNPIIERELFYRKKLAKIFCLKEDEFPNQRAYNDYLENIEHYVCNLVDGIQIEETEAAIARFKKQNADAIERNRKKLSEDDLWIKKMLDEEAELHKRVNAELQNETDQQKKKTADEINKEVLEELKSGGLPAEVIVDKRRKQQIEQEILARDAEKQKKLQKMATRQEKVTFGSIASAGAPYIHVLPRLHVSGPQLPSFEEMKILGYLNYAVVPTKDKIAGGFMPEIPLSRALFEARQDLFFGI